jgi:hypothetical protein
MESDETMEELVIVVDAVTDILEIIHNTDNPIQGLEILSAATAYVLCNCISSAKDADMAHDFFVKTLGIAMDKAESLGATMWTRGTIH